MGCLEASAALHSFKNSMKYEFVYYTINPFLVALITAQKMKFSIIDFFSKCDKIRRIWSHLLKKSLMENLIFCALYLSFISLMDLTGILNISPLLLDCLTGHYYNHLISRDIIYEEIKLGTSFFYDIEIYQKIRLK